MRYSGYNIQKEVITRRAKKPFDKIRKHNARNPYAVPSQRALTETLSRPKSIYERWWVLVICMVILAAAGLWARYEFVLKPAMAKKAIVEFEETGIQDYFNENKALFDSIHAFVVSTNHRLYKLGVGEYRGVHLSIKSDSQEGIELHATYIPGLLNENRYWVKNGALQFEDSEYNPKTAESWILDLSIDNMSELDQSFIDHLMTSKNELDHYLHRVYDLKWRVTFYHEGEEWHFRHLDQNYEFFIPNDELEVDPEIYSRMEQLMPGVFWRKYHYREF